MFRRQDEVRKIIKKHVAIPNHLEYQAALNSYSHDEPSLAVFDNAFADELFSRGLLSLAHLECATSLSEATATVDKYREIIGFYQKHYSVFSHITELKFFHDFIVKKGDLHCWNEIMAHPFAKLNSEQSTTLILDTLGRMSALTEKEGTTPGMRC